MNDALVTLDLLLFLLYSEIALIQGRLGLSENGLIVCVFFAEWGNLFLLFIQRGLQLIYDASEPFVFGLVLVFKILVVL